ncbi:F0F1 ATP synthase subunit delta [Aliarcobacter thereius]|uniref:ATP synthase subunit delta n=2 Tax=Aliarcobacter thereius TaxID=544718 RepID=A0A1C0B7N9_9BACT|nr:F0F1 ATP synthase subunit delta [Aliarcobacter thereius]OCL94085.1 F0F1 ATP synthase subunit delta [Aliarcobacter thereius]OCL95479.1 F0F1 ATP synthase subunit delta [Aliarcobacter thereius LMG 24486]OCL99619.1 F0F1 ATP synthase subunit delta [Aliarcobacter thereius]QBF16534.1 ATP synthase, F1 complex, delta subunit [Aliarcobacter thereius LMG 24486]TLS72999.1 F0F1 ATP synthase subunit delta [Aliarcobacter thereius]
MKDLVAKRYVKALLEARDLKEISSFSKKLNSVAKAFSNDKFKSILASSEINEVAKVEFVLSIIENPEKSLENFIKLLGEKRRLEIIPFVATELENQIAKLNNNFIGVIYTNKELPTKSITSIEEQFSKKFDVKLSLSQNVCDYDGIKVDIDGLGVEISFSKDRLKTQLINHILKAV